MSRTRIDWADYTINPVKGLCPVGCSYCYARRLYQRFGWNPEIRYDPYWVDQIPKRRGHRIFVGSTMELFGPWVDAGDLRAILHHCGQRPEHTFIFLTKQPQNLHKWSPFPDNCWVGATAANAGNVGFVIPQLGSIRARVKFISLEPLLHWPEDTHVTPWFNRLDWLIIGQQTPVRKSTMPKKSWIDEIEEACKKAGIPYFEKDNLKALLNRPLVQEFPR